MSDKMSETPEPLLAIHKMERIQIQAAERAAQSLHKGIDALHIEFCQWLHIIVSLPRVKLMEASIQENKKDINFEVA